MSAISTYLEHISSKIYAKDVRTAIVNAISQCYDDVNTPALQTEAMEAAVQAKIDAGEMAALTIADGSLTGAKLADGTIPTAKIADGAITAGKLASGAVSTDTTLTQSGIPADAAAVGDMKYLLDEISAINLNQIEWAPTIEKGYFLSLSNGKRISSSKYAKTNVLWFGSGSKDAVSFDNSDYEFCVAFYGANGATNGTDYIRSTGYIAGGTSTIYIPPEAKKFGISFRREDQVDLTDEDITAISEALKCYVIEQKPADASLDPLSTNAIQNAPVATEFNSVWDDLSKFKAKNLSSVDWNPTIRKGYFIKREGSNAGYVQSSSKYAYVTLPRWGAGVWEAVSALDSTYEFWVAYYDENADITKHIGYLGCSEILSGGTISHIPDIAIKFSMCFRRADQADLTDDDIIDIQSALVYYRLTADIVKEEVESIDKLAYGFYTSDDATITPTTFDGVIALYDALMASRPDYVTKNTLTSGNLTNYEYVFTSGNYNVNSGAGRNPDPMIEKPVILILAGIHGREKVGVMALYRIMKELCGNNYALADLINYVTIKVIPVGNPWGYTNNQRHNANDVDLNRNFATSTWGDYDPGEPGSYNYAGPSAGSEDETKIIQAWLTANSNAAFYIDYHNSAFASEVIEIGGPDTDESMIFKKKFLLAINKIIPYWQKARNMDSSSNYYCYTGGEWTVEGRVSRNYAYEAGIHLAYTCETSENVNSTGRNSLATINVGAEAVGNFLLGMTDYYKEI